MLDIMDISTTGLTANRNRLTAISNNIANMHTTRARLDRNGNAVPYQRRTTVFKQNGGVFGKTLAGVKAMNMRDPRANEGKKVYIPDHPDADTQGYVKMPNVDVVAEYTDAMLASRAYEANVQVMNVSKSMMNTAIAILA